LPGVKLGNHILIFSGFKTFGTQAAVEYVYHPETVAELLKKIAGPREEVRPFEAALETPIAGNAPMETRLVTIRVH
jgi:hypothetical protein